MSKREYALKFMKLSKYVPFMVSGSRARISMFVMGVSDLVSQECKTAMLTKIIWTFRAYDVCGAN